MWWAVIFFQPGKPGAPVTIPQVNPTVAFNLPAVVKDGDHWLGGIIRIHDFTANTDVTLTHNLGKIPHWCIPLWVLDDQANPPTHQVYTPKLRQSIVTAWSVKNVTIQADTTCTALAVLIL